MSGVFIFVNFDKSPHKFHRLNLLTLELNNLHDLTVSRSIGSATIIQPFKLTSYSTSEHGCGIRTYIRTMHTSRSTTTK